MKGFCFGYQKGFYPCSTASLYSYSYDGVGNRTNAFGTVNSVNEYSNFTYNARGDLTDDGTFTYTWNANDRLIAVTARDNSVKVTFQYDGQNRCIEKDAYASDGNNGWMLNFTRKFVYDGSNLIAELDANNNLMTGYAWGPNGLMSVTDYTSGTPQVYTAVLDGNGNVMQLVSLASGQVAATYSYDPYGKLLAESGPAAGVSNVLSDSGIYVRELDIVIEGDRDLSTRLDEWLSTDPIGEAGGLNTRIYGNNDPINEIDPSGDQPVAATYNRDRFLAAYWAATNEGWCPGTNGHSGRVREFLRVAVHAEALARFAQAGNKMSVAQWEDWLATYDQAAPEIANEVHDVSNGDYVTCRTRWMDYVKGNAPKCGPPQRGGQDSIEFVAVQEARKIRAMIDARKNPLDEIDHYVGDWNDRFGNVDFGGIRCGGADVRYTRHGFGMAAALQAGFAIEHPGPQVTSSSPDPIDAIVFAAAGGGAKAGTAIARRILGRTAVVEGAVGAECAVTKTFWGNVPARVTVANGVASVDLGFVVEMEGSEAEIAAMRDFATQNGATSAVVRFEAVNSKVANNMAARAVSGRTYLGGVVKDVTTPGGAPKFEIRFNKVSEAGK